MKELFTERRWTGEFFSPDSYEKRFCGEINYSPEKGLVLAYTIANNNFPADTELLHGILSTGDACTLVGQFSLRQHTSLNIRNRFTTHLGKTGFFYLALGEFLVDDEKFSEINFSLTNLQEFFYLNGRESNTKYSETPIYSINTSFGKLEFHNKAIFDFLNIDTHIYNKNSAALSELNIAFKKIQTKYPKSIFDIKKKLEYLIRLNFKYKVSVLDMYKQIEKTSDLFSLLTYNPTYPESIQLIKRGEKNQPKTISLYPSMNLDPRTMEIIKEYKPNYNMPIKQSTVDIDFIIKNWFENQKNYSSIVLSIQNETGFITEHAAHGDIILYATQFESISFTKNIKVKKYELPLKNYGSHNINSGLMKIFGKSTLEDTAKAIGELRNEIAHIEKPKLWLKNLSFAQLVEISQHLQLIVIGYELINIGVPKNVVETYQDQHCPRWGC